MRPFGAHKKTAELFLKDLELKSIRGELQIVEEKISVSDFFARYTDYCNLNKATYTALVRRRRITAWEHYLKECRVTKLKEITPLVVEGFQSKILAKGDSPTLSTGILSF